MHMDWFGPPFVTLRQLFRDRRGFGLSTTFNCSATAVFVPRCTAFLQYRLAKERSAFNTYASSGEGQKIPWIFSKSSWIRCGGGYSWMSDVEVLCRLGGKLFLCYFCIGISAGLLRTNMFSQWFCSHQKTCPNPKKKTPSKYSNLGYLSNISGV